MLQWKLAYMRARREYDQWTATIPPYRIHNQRRSSPAKPKIIDRWPLVKRGRLPGFGPSWFSPVPVNY